MESLSCDLWQITLARSGNLVQVVLAALWFFYGVTKLSILPPQERL